MQPLPARPGRRGKGCDGNPQAVGDLGDRLPGDGSARDGLLDRVGTAGGTGG
jgi:hypothetical protein